MPAFARRGIILSVIGLVAVLVFLAIWFNPHHIARRHVKQADHVEIIRLNPDDYTTGPLFSKYHVTAVKKWDTNPEVETTKQAMLEASNLGLELVKPGCDPSPGIGMRFWKAQTSVDALFCLECGLWKWKDTGNWHMMGGARNSIIQMTLQTFPRDKKLLDLKKRLNPQFH